MRISVSLKVHSEVDILKLTWFVVQICAFMSGKEPELNEVGSSNRAKDRIPHHADARGNSIGTQVVTSLFAS